MHPDKQVRRLQSLLYTSGVGIILFSIWSGLRGIESLFEIWNDLSLEYGMEPGTTALKIIVYLLIFVLLMGITFLYVYIGKTAMAVSCGEKKGHLYLVLSVLFILLSGFLYMFQFINSGIGELVEAKTIIYFIIDVTSNIILIEVIVFSLLLKKMR